MAMELVALERTNKYKVLYYEKLKYQPENLALLAEHFDIITLTDPSSATSEILSEIDIIFAPLGYYCGREKIEQANNLKVIASNTTGHSHIDVRCAEEKGVKVVTLKEQHAFLKTITPTAELTWGLIIALTRNMFSASKSVLDGKWDRRPFGGQAMLSRMSLGIAGFGRLGGMVAAYGTCFGMTVRYYDPYVPESEQKVDRVDSLEELVECSDILTIHIPHEHETENMFSEDILFRIKTGAYLINTSRGELVDNSALLKCLKNGKLAGAALDVMGGEYYEEFPQQLQNHPILEYARTHDNLLVTPHIGGSTKDAWKLTESFTIKMVVDELQTIGKSKN